MKGRIIAIDFDGTVVTHEFPKVGKEVPFCVDTLKKIVEQGGRLILWTMRANHIVPPISTSPEITCEVGNYLDDAVNWFKDRGIELWGIQRNPEQDAWTTSPKAYAHLYIDDAAFGCPLVHNLIFAERPYVDWTVVDALLFPEEL